MSPLLGPSSDLSLFPVQQEIINTDRDALAPPGEGYSALYGLIKVKSYMKIKTATAHFLSFGTDYTEECC